MWLVSAMPKFLKVSLNLLLAASMQLAAIHSNSASRIASVFDSGSRMS